jgi:deoxycytidylate deaminase
MSTGADLREPPAHIVQLAVEAATCSPCRSKRGVAIFNGADLVTVGYNYKPRGFDCDGSSACKATCREQAVHAEQAALITAPWPVLGAEMLHVKAVDGALVASGGPSCVQCSKLILSSGIAGMWLYEDHGWRRYEAAEFHRLSLDALLTGTPVMKKDDEETQSRVGESNSPRLPVTTAGE